MSEPSDTPAPDTASPGTPLPDLPPPDLAPIVRLRSGKAGRLAAGHPWAYGDEIAMDRRTRALAPGTIVRLEQGERAFGVAAFNAESTIAARVLDPDPEARIDGAWLAGRLARALALREALFDTPHYRLVHAEGDGLPGLVIDRYGDALAMQPNAAWAERLLPALLAAAAELPGVARIVVNGGSRVRRLEGLDERVEVALGTVADPVAVPMNGATYMADLLGGQKTGLYYDQRPNHALAARLARGRRVLDVFCHVGGFALAALAAGAEHALGIDGSAPALALAAEGARRSGLADRLEARRADAFEALTALGAAGARYGLVVSDPPAFAPNRAALANGLRAYERLARLSAATVEPGGFLVLCSCSHAADAERFLDACHAGIRRAGRSAQLIASGRAGPDHPQHPGLPETGYLKALFFRLDG